MRMASVIPLLHAAAALLVGVVCASAPALAQQSWSPTVAPITKSEAIHRAMDAMPVPRTPPRRPVAVPVASPPVPEPKPDRDKSKKLVLIPVDDVTTGAIGKSKENGVPSPADAARLFSEDGQAASSDLTTGAVDGQGGDLARGYCAGISNSAAEARIALQKAKLAEMEQQIGRRIATLEAKSAEYKSWVERRDQFLKRATTTLVKIYTQMEPDAAASQLVSMDEETAASLLVKLDPQAASAILNEMAPEKAARLAATIAGAARMPAANSAAARPPAPNPGEGRS